MKKLIKIAAILGILYGILVFVTDGIRGQWKAEDNKEVWCHNIDEQLRVIRMPPVEQPARIAQLEEQRSILHCP